MSAIHIDIMYYFNLPEPKLPVCQSLKSANKSLTVLNLILTVSEHIQCMTAPEGDVLEKDSAPGR